MISLLPGRVEGVNDKMNVTECYTSSTKWIGCRKICCLLSPFAWDKKMHLNCSWMPVFSPYCVCDLHGPFAFSLIIYPITRYHKLCTSTCMAWQWILYLCRQTLSLSSWWSWLLWQSLSSIPFRHAFTLEKTGPLRRLLSLRVNHLMILSGPSCHQQFQLKIICINFHKYSPHDTITIVT